YANEMIQYGANPAITVSLGNWTECTSEASARPLLEVTKNEETYGVVMGHTSAGRNVTPKVASRMTSGVITAVRELVAEGDNPDFVHTIYSRKAFEKKVIKDGLVFATNRPNNIASLEKDESRTGEVEAKDIDIKDLRTVIKDIIRKQTDGVDM